MSQDLSTLNGGGGRNREARGQSFFGRAIYSLLDRYVLTGTVRRDGSSNFGAGNRYGTFPSASVLWRVTEENFMKKQDIFSKLNLRLGWGQVGNAGNSTNLSVDQLTSARIAYYFFDANGQPVIAPGLAQTQEIDTNLRWETNETKNVNLEMGFLKNTITLSVEYFVRDAKDLLLYRGVRPSTGYSTVYTNAGQIRNSGFEFFAVYQKKVGDWSYNFKLNGSTLKNKVIDVGDPIVSSDGVGVNDGWNDWSRTMDGYPIASFYGYRVAGVFQNQQQIDQMNAQAAQKGAPDNTYQGQAAKPGDFIYKDLNNDGYVTEADREILGNGFPTLNYGLNASVSYKNWDFNLFIYGIAGQQILSYSYKNLTSMAGLGYRNILKSAAENAWTPENQSNSNSRLTNKDLNQNGRVSDAWLQNGDFLRFQNIQIGYTFSKKLIHPLKMESARLSASIENLATVTGYKGGDPEIGGNLSSTNGVLQTGLDAGRYPFPRTFSIGISIGF
jgi:TonB-linked SusC/RagA family outer membrane protein